MESAVSRAATAELAPLLKLMAENPRYKIEAYQFVGAGLEYAQEVLGLGHPGPMKKRRGKEKAAAARPLRHVSGQELCRALLQLAHRQYGLMAKLVLASWGIQSTSDFGEIVY